MQAMPLRHGWCVRGTGGDSQQVDADGLPELLLVLVGLQLPGRDPMDVQNPAVIGLSKRNYDEITAVLSSVPPPFDVAFSPVPNCP